MLKMFSYPSSKTLDQLNFMLATGAPRTAITELSSLAFIEQRNKTRFISAADLILQLSSAQRQGKLNSYMQRNRAINPILAMLMGFKNNNLNIYQLEDNITSTKITHWQSVFQPHRELINHCKLL